MRRSHRGDAPVYGAAEGDDRCVLRAAWTGGAGHQYGESGGVHDQGAGGRDAEVAAGDEGEEAVREAGEVVVIRCAVVD